MHRWCLLNLTVQGFSLNLTVRGVSNKHCLLTFFIESDSVPHVETLINYIFQLRSKWCINLFLIGTYEVIITYLRLS